MYTLFIQKQKADISPFPLTMQLNNFFKRTEANGVIISPAHLSHSTSNVNNLLDSLLSGTSITSFGILNRFGANTINLYETYLSSKGILLEVDRNGLSNHSKIVFVYKIPDGIYFKKIDKHNYEDFLEKIDVIGVAIGSSNFSYNTYGNLGSPIFVADKGEADILMFYNDDFRFHIESHLKNKIEDEMPDNQSLILSESLTPVDRNFLKGMLRNTLVQSL